MVAAGAISFEVDTNRYVDNIGLTLTYLGLLGTFLFALQNDAAFALEINILKSLPIETFLLPVEFDWRWTSFKEQQVHIIKAYTPAPCHQQLNIMQRALPSPHDTRKSFTLGLNTNYW